jgi:hypothetical protein
MPAGLNHGPSARRFARDEVVCPHLRTGEVTLISTTGEICFQHQLLLREAGVATVKSRFRCSSAFSNACRGTGPGTRGLSKPISRHFCRCAPNRCRAISSQDS